ncbi:MAG TPA: prenyltransferase/squalene oxidase repeat-containing protein [Polyangiaceae bacterium]
MMLSVARLFCGVLALAACDANAPAVTAPSSEKKRTDTPCLPSRAPSSPAELSGIQGALRLPAAPRDALEPLTTCDVYRLTSTEPMYLGRVDEGNVAPYGVLLAAEPSPKLAERLLSYEKRGQWEYSAGYGPTSADTAMVLEGLLKAGTDRRRLTDSLSSLARDYFDAESGGFRTVLSGRARYWEGVSTETTAHIAYLMQRVDPATFAREIEQAKDFVLKRQADDGHWDGRWFPSLVLPTFHAVRLLAALGNHDAPMSRAVTFLLRLQRPDGSFAGSVIETSLAVLALAAANGSSEAVARGRAWLRSRTSGETCTPGETFLYYWFELDAETRVFLSCSDRGPLARAWAKLALSP